MNWVKWLRPGLHVKRWLVLFVMGTVFTALGIAYIAIHVYRQEPFPAVVYYVTLQFIDQLWRGVLFITVGTFLGIVSFWQLSRSLLSPFITSGQSVSLADLVYRARYLDKGPRIVAVGGGTGLSTLLRGLKKYSDHITAVVTVADDGGSSGRLRRELGVLPPGDFRQCIAALAEAEPLMTELFQYRFDQGTGLDGHSFGNLFIVAMSGITGNFERALRESSRVLAVRGQILPSTVENVTLCAELDDASFVEGESKLPYGPAPIKRAYLRPSDAAAFPEALKAIAEADLIILGPGSLYTSIMPNLLVEGIASAIRQAKGTKVYVCNVASQPGETDGYNLSKHVESLESHVGKGLFSYVLANDHLVALPEEWHVNAIDIDGASLNRPGLRVITADVIDVERPTRHDPSKLAAAIMGSFWQNRGRSDVS
ncbi:MAG: YvcK family protein [Chloroflexota bacterium]|nr:YvcK family protein [Chloroflexota bacterium]